MEAYSGVTLTSELPYLPPLGNASPTDLDSGVPIFPHYSKCTFPMALPRTLGIVIPSVTLPYHPYCNLTRLNASAPPSRWGLGPLPLPPFFFSAFPSFSSSFFSLSKGNWVLLHYSIFLEIPPYPPFPLHFHTHPSEWFNRMFSSLSNMLSTHMLTFLLQRRSRFPPYGSGP